MSHRYILPIEENEDTGELFVTLPDTLLEEAGWYYGDELQYEIEDDKIILRKFIEP